MASRDSLPDTFALTVPGKYVGGLVMLGVLGIALLAGGVYCAVLAWQYPGPAVLAAILLLVTGVAVVWATASALRLIVSGLTLRFDADGIEVTSVRHTRIAWADLLAVGVDSSVEQTLVVLPRPGAPGIGRTRYLPMYPSIVDGHVRVAPLARLDQPVEAIVESLHHHAPSDLRVQYGVHPQRHDLRTVATDNAPDTADRPADVRSHFEVSVPQLVGWSAPWFVLGAVGLVPFLLGLRDVVAAVLAGAEPEAGVIINFVLAAVLVAPAARRLMGLRTSTIDLTTTGVRIDSWGRVREIDWGSVTALSITQSVPGFARYNVEAALRAGASVGRLNGPFASPRNLLASRRVLLVPAYDDRLIASLRHLSGLDIDDRGGLEARLRKQRLTG